jgi:4-hydroxyproline epimerase
MPPAKIHVLDTHTAGEPTRVVIAGGPDLGTGSLAQRREVFRAKFDEFRSAIVCEPRGSDVMVGALLCPPADPDCAAAAIFFNNVGYLGMCGHGAIGVAAIVARLGKIASGGFRLETPVGAVAVEYHGGAKFSIENVPAFRQSAGVAVEVDGHGRVSGDVAWGGNWFFLTSDHGQELELARTGELTQFAWAVRRALRANGVTGADGAEIDHIELFGPPRSEGADSRNFVLCPGGAFDRSPCGTGTSAKVACLAAEGKLAPGEVWRQESIVGSLFEASYRRDEAGRCIPRITGEAFVTAEATLLFDPADPFRAGIRP